MTREIKDSGIEWIGDIPKHWEVVPSNLFFYNSSEKINAETDEKVEQLTASQKYGVISQRKYMGLETQKPVQKQNLNDLKRVEKNDFVISLRSFEGGIEIAQESGGITPAYTVIKEKTNKTKSGYYKYLFKSNMYIQALRSTVLDTIRDGKSIKYTHFSMVPIVLPPIREQEKIAEKLAELNNNIDNIINETKKSIEELKKYKQSILTETVTKGLDPNAKMIDSSIKWIGKYPINWKIFRLKNIFSLKGRIGWQGLNSSEYKEKGAHLITGTDFEEGQINWNNCVRISEERFLEAPEIHIKENDLLITKDGTIGKVAIANNVPEKASLNSGVLLMREITSDYIKKKYMYYILLSEIFWNWFNYSDLGGSTIRHLYQGQFYNFSFPLPSIEEQKEIISYLDIKTKRIDTLIQDKEIAIEELEKYKKSLIYEYVTGKKEV